MTSAYAVAPTSSLRDDRLPGSNNSSPPGSRHHQHRQPPVGPLDSNHLSPFLSNNFHQINSASASPTLNNASTPADSTSTYGHYQSSDYSDIDDADPFFGVDFNSAEGGTPSFLDNDSIAPVSRTSSFPQQPMTTYPVNGTPRHHAFDNIAYPLSPDQTASVHTASPGSERRGIARVDSGGLLPDSVSPHELQRPFNKAGAAMPSYTTNPAAQLTPDLSGSGRSSEEGLVPAPPSLLQSQSPRVTVSLWGKDSGQPVHAVERSFSRDEDSHPRPGVGSAGDLISSGDQIMPPPPPPRDDTATWHRNRANSRRGLNPENRPTGEVDSVNEIMTRREIEQKNLQVDEWLSRSNITSPPQQVSDADMEAADRDAKSRNDGISLGSTTENKLLPGQTYYQMQGGELTPEDLEIMRSNQRWADAPMLPSISGPGDKRYQPETSNAAIQRFERLCRDNESIISKAATWGTRRRSLPSLKDIDIEGITSGNFLRKLTINRSDLRRPSFIKDLRGLVRKPSASQLLKRSRTFHDEESLRSADISGPSDKRDCIPHLAPPKRTSSWGTKKSSMPSINTALVSMGTGVASIGTTHARTGSISATPVTSPKSPFGSLSVKNTLRRPRSKSDLPKGAPVAETHPNLVDMLRKAGGPPVAALARTSSISLNNVEADDDDDEDDDLYEDSDMKVESSKLIEDITPTFAGFQQHILRLNPGLESTNTYLVDRIAMQQVQRYKNLLSAKVKHLQLGAGCPCGPLCVALGGQAVVFEQKGNAGHGGGVGSGGVDPLSIGLDPEDGEATPIEGVITQDSFPPDIPVPPTTSLPAEFECQLCFQTKKFQKPSDWTKHVHEDVQPFTCTWDRCRDPKIFKRKADWVRHENEGHRHLEWWTCDVDDCKHTCYRRDNFLQHLVREHKFTEPKVKTKAAMKRAGGIDPTWVKVEKCHEETGKRPQEEACRFCGKTFPSWKKLTVHLAKHMEQISLPVLRLVAAKELDPDTIISPVQDPPPRTFNPPAQVSDHPAVVKKEQHQQQPQQQPLPQQQPYSNPYSQPPSSALANPLVFSGESGTNPFAYPDMTGTQFAQQMFSQPYDTIGQALTTDSMSMQPLNAAGGQNYTSSPPFHAGSAPAFAAAQHQYIPVTQHLEPFPDLPQNTLGLQHTAQVPFGSAFDYQALMDQSTGHPDPFNPQASTSPFAQNSFQGGNNYYQQ